MNEIIVYRASTGEKIRKEVARINKDYSKGNSYFNAEMHPSENFIVEIVEVYNE